MSHLEDMKKAVMEQLDKEILNSKDTDKVLKLLGNIEKELKKSNEPVKPSATDKWNKEQEQKAVFQRIANMTYKDRMKFLNENPDIAKEFIQGD
jgi:hemerythrin superfamily protein